MGYPPPPVPHSKGLRGMGYGSSRQTKELVPSSRITKELGRPKIDWFFSSSVFQFFSKTKAAMRSAPACPR